MKYRPEYNPKIIGENLRRLRKAKGLSVEFVKEYLRLGSVQAIYKYENGQGYPQVDTMFALMELYEASLSDIIDNHLNMEPDTIEHIIQSITVKFYHEGKELQMNIDCPSTISVFKKQQNERLLKYYELFKKGIAS